MRLSILLPLCLILSFIGLSAQEVKWEEKFIAKGLVWKSSHQELFGGKLHINLLEIDVTQREVDLLHTPGELKKTSELATKHNALAAINAGFFDKKTRQNVGYIKYQGTPLGRWETRGVLNGLLGFRLDGRVSISKVRTHDIYSNNPAYSGALLTGPLLIENKKALPLKPTPFTSNRHPRSLACEVDESTLLLITVDGRTNQSIGITLPQAQDLLLDLGCRNAINLDGGGSTTMWIKPQKTHSKNGVVNYPSDNFSADHEGERNVSSIIAVF